MVANDSLNTLQQRQKRRGRVLAAALCAFGAMQLPVPEALAQVPGMTCETTMVTMREGVQLYTEINKPEQATTPLPTVVVRNPYARNFGGMDALLIRVVDPRLTINDFDPELIKAIGSEPRFTMFGPGFQYRRLRTANASMWLFHLWGQLDFVAFAYPPSLAAEVERRAGLHP